jgi:hypothetical protein
LDLHDPLELAAARSTAREQTDDMVVQPQDRGVDAAPS